MMHIATVNCDSLVIGVIIIACEDLMNGAIFVNYFSAKYLWLWDYDYHIVCLLCGNYSSLHCSMPSTCTGATVCYIRYFNWQKIRYLFVWLIIINLHCVVGMYVYTCTCTSACIYIHTYIAMYVQHVRIFIHT